MTLRDKVNIRTCFNRKMLADNAKKRKKENTKNMFEL